MLNPNRLAERFVKALRTEYSDPMESAKMTQTLRRVAFPEYHEGGFRALGLGLLLAVMTAVPIFYDGPDEATKESFNANLRGTLVYDRPSLSELAPIAPTLEATRTPITASPTPFDFVQRSLSAPSR